MLSNFRESRGDAIQHYRTDGTANANVKPTEREENEITGTGRFCRNEWLNRQADERQTPAGRFVLPLAFVKFAKRTESYDNDLERFDSRYVSEKFVRNDLHGDASNVQAFSVTEASSATFTVTCTCGEPREYHTHDGRAIH